MVYCFGYFFYRMSNSIPHIQFKWYFMDVKSLNRRTIIAYIILRLLLLVNKNKQCQCYVWRSVRIKMLQSEKKCIAAPKTTKKQQQEKNDYVATIFETGHSVRPQSSFVSINLFILFFARLFVLTVFLLIFPIP